MSEQLERYRFCNWWDKLEKKGIGHGYRTVEVRSVKTDKEAREEIKIKNRLVETKARSKQGLQTEIYFMKEV